MKWVLLIALGGTGLQQIPMQDEQICERAQAKLHDGFAVKKEDGGWLLTVRNHQVFRSICIQTQR